VSIKMAKNNEKNKKNNIYCTKNTIDMGKEGIRERLKTGIFTRKQ